MHLHSLTQSDIQALAYVMGRASTTEEPLAVPAARVEFGIDDAMRDELIEATDCVLDFWRVAMETSDSRDRMTAEHHHDRLCDLRNALSTPTSPKGLIK